MSLIYNLFIYLYSGFIHLFSIISPKAKLWIQGRKGLFSRISAELSSMENIVWIHAASLGEFEQGRPVIEEIKHTYPGYKILLTFYSPSGFEVRKNYPHADFIYYLPADTPRNARKFTRIVQPKVVIFIKYEFWFNFIKGFEGRNIPFFVISAIFRKDQHFFKWYGSWFRKMLRKVTCFFVQNRESKDLLDSAGVANVIVSGDTRFDRVYEASKNSHLFPDIVKFTDGKKTLLIGSSWQPEEDLVFSILDRLRDIKIIIAPHEVHESRIKSIESRFREFHPVRYSRFDPENIGGQRVLIIDSIGILSGLYRHCDMAFIGGGFGKGIHNILEACTFGKPVIFGPHYRKFKEAVDLIQMKGAFCVNSVEELFNVLESLFKDTNRYQNCSDVCRNYIDQNRGATKTIIQRIGEYL